MQLTASNSRNSLTVISSKSIEPMLHWNQRAVPLVVSVLVGLGLVTVVSVASGKDDPAKVPTEKKDHNFPPTAWDYAQLVEPILGVPPKVDLGEAIEMPTFIDGEQVHGLFEDCDNPSRLGRKNCMSGSVVQRYEGQTADGTPLPDVVWVAFGRNASGFNIGILGSVQMIGYHTVTGATAFFESSDRIEPWAYLDEETQRLKGKMPWIDDPEEFNQAYKTPRTVQCVSCHQNDPFIHNSFIDAARMPETGRPVVPVVRTRDMEFETELPYYVIGGEDWDMRTIYIEGNRCVGCHRIGMGTLNLFMQAGWNPHEEMPPGRPGKYQHDFEELMDCWTNSPEKTPDCHWIIPPGASTPGQIVGEDYPFKANFNTPRLASEMVNEDLQVAGKLRDLESELEKTEQALRDGSISSEEAAEQKKALEYWISVLRDVQSSKDSKESFSSDSKTSHLDKATQGADRKGHTFGKGSQ
ncbi:MAG: hypothetical protein F4X44_01600 [Gammaproteobacteria bacterium]|nr:hypothetical protein [Gammaproteobacteria bacterium]